MDFFNKIGDSMQNLGKEVTKKTKDLSGAVSLSAQIKESESNLEKVYKVMGEKYYTLYQEEAVSRFTEETDEIIKIQAKLAKDKEQLRALKGLKLCSNCGAEVDMSCAHCPMCGSELAASQDSAGTETQEKPLFCPSCGAELSADAKFCGKCGTKVN